MTLKERDPWNTPTESCESDTEDEEVKPFSAHPGTPDPLIEETRIRESLFGCLIDVITKAESRLHPRYKQMKDGRPFELSDQKRLSNLGWNAGPKRDKVANSLVRSFHVVLVQEAETHHREIVTNAEQQLHVDQGVDQLIPCNKSTLRCEDP